MKKFTFALVVLAILTTACGKDNGSMMSPSTASAQTVNATAVGTLRFEPFVTDNLYDRAAIGLGPDVDGLSVRGYNLGAQGYTKPVATVRFEVIYDPAAVRYLGPMAYAGWNVQDLSVLGRIVVIFRSDTGDVTGDALLGRLRFVAIPGRWETLVMEVVNNWTADGSIAYAADGTYSFVNDFGGGTYHHEGGR